MRAEVVLGSIGSLQLPLARISYSIDFTTILHTTQQVPPLSASYHGHAKVKQMLLKCQSSFPSDYLSVTVYPTAPSLVLAIFRSFHSTSFITFKLTGSSSQFFLTSSFLASGQESMTSLGGPWILMYRGTPQVLQK
jgi:hypothetical protein